MALNCCSGMETWREFASSNIFFLLWCTWPPGWTTTKRSWRVPCPRQRLLVLKEFQMKDLYNVSGCARWHQETCDSWSLQERLPSDHLPKNPLHHTKRAGQKLLLFLHWFEKMYQCQPKTSLEIAVNLRVMDKGMVPPGLHSQKSGSGARLLPFFLAHLWLAGAVAAHLGRERQCWELSQAPQWNMQAEGIVIEHLSCCGLSVWYSMERCWCWGAKRCKIDWSAVWGQFVYVVFQYSWLSKVSSETSC